MFNLSLPNVFLNNYNRIVHTDHHHEYLKNLISKFLLGSFYVIFSLPYPIAKRQYFQNAFKIFKMVFHIFINLIPHWIYIFHDFHSLLQIS